MRILLAGHLGYNMIVPLCKGLKDKLPESIIGAVGLYHPSKSVDELNNTGIDHLINESPKFSSSEIKSQLYTFQFLLNVVPLLFMSGFKPTQFKKSIIKWTTDNKKDNYLKNIFLKYEIINFHYIANASHQFLKYVNNSHKVMLTFWGSDLMQNHSDEIFSKQYELVKRADVIIMHTPEMKKIFISKFGDNFTSKIKLHFFGLNDEKFKLIDAVKKDSSKTQDFKTKFNIPNKKLKLLVGYSGAKGQQHLAILNELEKQTEQFSDKFHLLIPMTYGNHSKEYFLEVKHKIKSLNYSFTHFAEYLNEVENACLYNVTDIFINVRETDAFNGTMIECLYLDKIGIIGSWLPYSMLKKLKINYLEIDHISEINATLSSIISDNIQPYSNKEKIYSFTSTKFTINKWCKIYQELNEQ